MKSLDELQDFKVTKADKKLVEHVTSNKKKRDEKEKIVSAPTKKKAKKSDDKKYKEKFLKRFVLCVCEYNNSDQKSHYY